MSFSRYQALVFLSAVAAVLGLVAFVPHSVAQQESPNDTASNGLFVHQEHEFSVQIPPDFEVFRDPTSYVGLLARHKSSFYPTFNVVIQPGPYRAQKTEITAQLKKIEESYALVGITDAQYLEAYKSQLAGRNCFTAKISYSLEHKEYISLVMVVSGVTKHYVLTFIDLKANYEKDKQIADSLFTGFSTWSDKGNRENAGASSHQGVGWVWRSSLLLVVCSLILFSGVIWWRKHNQNIS